MLQREQHLQTNLNLNPLDSEVNYKPNDVIIQLRRLIKLIHYDIRYYIINNYLFDHAIDDL